MQTDKNSLLTIAAFAAIAFGVASCKPAGDTASQAPAVDSTAQQNADIARQFVDEVFNKGNVAFAEQHVDSSIVDHDMYPGQEPGLNGFKKMVADMRTGFPDGKTTIEDVVAKGDEVAIRTTFSGTNKGAMMGMPATNKQVKDVEGIDVMKFKNGKVTDHWGQMDVMKMMTQLGMPPGGPAPAGQPGSAQPTTGESSAKKMDTATKAK